MKISKNSKSETETTEKDKPGKDNSEKDQYQTMTILKSELCKMTSEKRTSETTQF